ncbi:unnamed protein product [Moneuplotes crassus]|uniref:histidine kinase n=1 Tax=Euplotes crassus TaxID=5936 RepID=A0AAD1XZU4_EUPCR|nr:unnamed protein product [Moneuplotes crassus]
MSTSESVQPQDPLPANPPLPAHSPLEVDDYIKDVIEETVQKTYKKYIQITCWALIIIVSLLALVSYLNLTESNRETHMKACVNSIIFVVMICVALMVMRYKPVWILYFVPLVIGVSTYLAVDHTLTKDFYKLSEHLLSNSCFCHTLVILVPNKWKSSSLVFSCLMLYLGYGIWKSYNISNADIITNVLCSSIWFTLSNYLLMVKTRAMYSEILKNKKLINEMKKVLQILPFGVVIWPSESEGKWFTNQEFTHKFTKVRKDLEELNDLEISFPSNSNKESDISCLSDLLKMQHKALDSTDLMIEKETKITCNPQKADLAIEENEETDKRICNIKTLMIEWEGVNSYMHVFIDNTDIIKLQEVKRRVELEEANNNIKLQKLMFASASHEFRTPLNSITNSIDIVLNSFNVIHDIAEPYFKYLEDDQREEIDSNVDIVQKFVKIGKSSSMLLLTLIEDVLNLSKMEAGTFMVSKELFSIREVLEEVYDIFSMQCEHKKLGFTLDMCNEIRDGQIYADKSRIKQVVLNLISNSLKFTFEGSITIGCKIVEHGDKMFAEFQVRDTGIGISAKEQDKLFKLFGMLTDTKKINPNGSGIGLTVSKKYVEAMGGEIHLKSACKIGTDVTFSIPIDENSTILPLLLNNPLIYPPTSLAHRTLSSSPGIKLCSKGKFLQK